MGIHLGSDRTPGMNETQMNNNVNTATTAQISASALPELENGFQKLYSHSEV